MLEYWFTGMYGESGRWDREEAVACGLVKPVLGGEE